MNAASWIALIGFIPISLVIYALMPPRRAFIWVMFGGFMFLPVAGIVLPVVADYGKDSAPAYMALLGTLVYHPRLLLEYRPKWFDLPMIFWVLWQIPPSIANGHGLYDGLSQLVNFGIGWALPYFLTRCYFTRPEHLKEVALAVVGAGLIYLPLCLFELRMSPCLHFWIYGRYPSPFFDMVRLGGYRPVVFMQHGLMLGFFMCSAAFVAGWLWWHRKESGIQRIGWVPLGWAVLGLVPMAVLTKSSGSIMIYVALTGLVLLSRAGRWKWVLAVPVVLMPSYIAGRTMEWTDGRFMLDVTQAIFSSEQGRDGSLIARLNQEDVVVVKIRQKPWTGWGNWGYGLDQMWLLLARNTGMPTIAAWLIVFSLPLLLVLKSDLRHRRDLLLYGIPLGIVLVGWVMDGLFNGMFNPMWLVCAAAVMTAATDKVNVPTAKQAVHNPTFKRQFGISPELPNPSQPTPSGG